MSRPSTYTCICAKYQLLHTHICMSQTPCQVEENQKIGKSWKIRCFVCRPSDAFGFSSTWQFFNVVAIWAMMKMLAMSIKRTRRPPVAASFSCPLLPPATASCLLLPQFLTITNKVHEHRVTLAALLLTPHKPHKSQGCVQLCQFNAFYSTLYPCRTLSPACLFHPTPT